MNTLLKRIVLVSAAVMALTVAVSSVASAGTWGPLNSMHTIDSPNLSVNIATIGSGWICDTTTMTAAVGASASSSLPISSLVFGMCRGTGGAAGCPVDIVPTGLPYAATGASTTNVTLTTMNWNLSFTAGCGFAGSAWNLEGALVGGVWNASAHSLTFANAGGLQATVAGSPLGPVTVTGTFTDTSGTLTLS